MNLNDHKRIMLMKKLNKLGLNPFHVGELVSSVNYNSELFDDVMRLISFLLKKSYEVNTKGKLFYKE